MFGREDQAVFRLAVTTARISDTATTSAYDFQAFFETLAQPIDTAQVIELAH